MRFDILSVSKVSAYETERLETSVTILLIYSSIVSQPLSTFSSRSASPPRWTYHEPSSRSPPVRSRPIAVARSDIYIVRLSANTLSRDLSFNVGVEQSLFYQPFLCDVIKTTIWVNPGGVSIDY